MNALALAALAAATRLQAGSVPADSAASPLVIVPARFAAAIPPLASSLLPPPGTPAGEAARAAAVGGLFLLLFAAAEGWRRWARPPVEWTRKSVHIGGGLVALAFPWIFSSHWAVLGLGIAFGLILWGTRKLGLLGSVHGVERRSEGGLYYPVAIYLLFLIGADTPVFYLISLLALVLSDAFAALLGTAYGRHTYRVETDQRSVEGSAVFFFTTFLGVHLPLLLLTQVDRAATVLVAVQIALLVTFLEAVSLRGNDNLIVPIATYYLLAKLTPHSSSFIAGQLLAQLLILAVIGWLAWRSRLLTVSGALAATLFFYGALTLGGPVWIVAPAVAIAVFLGFYQRSRSRPGSRTPSYQVLAVFYTGIVPLALYALSDTMESVRGSPGGAATDPIYPVYLGAVAAQLAMLVLVWMEGPEPDRRLAAERAVPALLVGAGVIPVGALAAALAGAGWGIAVATTVAGFAAYLALRHVTPGPGMADLRVHAVCAGAGAAAILPVQLLP